MTFFDDVKDWHQKMGLRTSLEDYDIPSKVFAGRIRLITEEFSELTKAFMVNGFVEFADALADLTWVVLGTAVEFGLPFNEVWEEVKKSNFTKIGGKPDAGGKIMKPVNYHPPEIGKILGKKMNNETAGENPPRVNGSFRDFQMCQNCRHKKFPSHQLISNHSYVCRECGMYCQI